MTEMKRSREKLNRTQEQVVQDLDELAARLFTAGHIRRRPTFSIRQYAKWEGANPPWPHPAARHVLAVYWNRPFDTLGFRRPATGESDTGDRIPSPSLLPGRRPVVAGLSLSAGSPDASFSPLRPAGAAAVDISLTEWRVDEAEVELLCAAADDMDAIDQQFGGNRLWRPTRAHLHWVQHMITRGIYSRATERQLHAVAGKFSTSLGWFSYDAGLQSQARQHFNEALNTAMSTGDDMLAARTLSNMARQAVDLDKGREAVRFARLGNAHAEQWRAPARVVALLAIREAQGHARSGDVFQCKAALRRAWLAWERGTTDRDPDWVEFLNEAEMICLEGMCLLDLEQSGRAQQLLTRSEALQDVPHSRNRGMCLGRLSVAAMHNDDINHSVAAATESLRLIEGGMASTRATYQLRIVHDGLVPRRRSAGVQDLLEHIRTHVA